jgi:hypothetical protein
MPLLMVIVLLAMRSGQLTALIDHDRVTASYPGFHRTQGGVAAFVANGIERRLHGTSMPDTIVIRKVASLSPLQASEFNLAAAIRTARANERIPQDADIIRRSAPEDEQAFVACGRHAYGFAEFRKLRLDALDGSSTYTELDAYVFEVVGSDVWQARYSRLYEPGEKAHGPSLIEFTSNFCVEQHFH